MDEITGSILELTDKKALIMTESCDFISIARQPQMFVGQQVKVRKSDIAKTNKSYVKYALLAASVFILALFSVFYFRIFVSNTVYAYIDVDINPSVEFSIDKSAKVLDLKPLNSDAEALLKDMDLVDLPIKDAINQVVKTSEKMGFISADKENAILISAAVDENGKEVTNSSEAKAFDKIISNISNINFDFGYQTVKPEILKVTPESRKAAVKNNISMGRYALYSELKKENNDITVEKAKTTRVSDMLKNSKKHKNELENSNSGNSSSAYTESGNSNSGNSTESDNSVSEDSNTNYTKSDNADAVITDDKHTFFDDSEKASPKHSNAKNNELDTNNSNSNKKSKINNKDRNEKEYQNGNNKKDKIELPNSSNNKKDKFEDSYNNEKADSAGNTKKPEEPKTTPSFNPDNEKANKKNNNNSGNEVKPSDNGSSNERTEDNSNYKNNKEANSDKSSNSETNDNSSRNSDSQGNHGNSQNDNQSNDKSEHGKK